jgi:hypothetical protein
MRVSICPATFKLRAGGTVLRRDVGEASEPFRVSSASLPNSITQVGIELFSHRQIRW